MTILVLIFTLQTPSQADDIRDFQIEGMSIGDSLLDYYSESEISNFPIRNYQKNKYKIIYAIKHKYLSGVKSNLSLYEAVEIVVKINDHKFIIEQILGILLYRKNIDECYKKKELISSEITEIFQDNVQKRSYKKKHSADKTGNSLNTTTQFEFITKDVLRISCYDWSEKITKEKNFIDNLRVTLISANFRNWLNTEAYK